MHVLLPPSETKRDGGVEGTALDLGALGFPALNPVRRSMLAAVRSLSSNRRKAAAALKLGATQLFEIDRNRALRHSPVMAAMDRYTGVLYEALDAASLPAAARSLAATSVVVHSALFGLVRATDPIPAYRLSHDSRLPGHPLGRTWRAGLAGELAHLPGLILDLRSESYAVLGPAPEHSLFLRVVTEEGGGARRALNHFNKKGKGEFVRALLLAEVDHPDADSLLRWAAATGIRLERGEPGELQLVV
ncbi:peroxide stress protein YaaA [Leifsonia bigeumensis]|uniref:Peroxide stress protein YaaA n=1 Tax=Leifsonella bigeumensis TaxID=433643 RepID=A0ABP7FUV5_9MICO